MASRETAGERQLIRLAQQGDTEAFGQLLVQHQRAVFNIAFRMMGNRQEAEDVAQESFVKAYQALDRFDRDRPFAPWLYRITTNTALNWIKRRRPEAELEDETLHVSAAGSPEEQAIAAEASDRLRKAVTALPPNYRAAIELRHFQGLSYQEMSETLGVPLSDVKSWLFRARRKLRETLA